MFDNIRHEPEFQKITRELEKIHGRTRKNQKTGHSHRLETGVE
jgi:hypothetical protein